MFSFIMYTLVATAVTALCQKKLYANMFFDYESPPRMLVSVVTGIFWPIALFAVLPVVLVYKGVSKVIDKF